MKNPALFQYLTAFVTIVLAIALSDMLMSAHRLVLARRRVRWAVIPLAAAVFVMLNVLSEFFSIWVEADVKAVSFPYLVVLVLVSGCTAMAAFAALPDEIPPQGLDLWALYIERRVYLYGILALGLVGDMLRFTLHGGGANAPGGRHHAEMFYLTDATAIGLLAVLAWARDWRLHAAILLILFGYVYYGFLGWAIR